MRLAPFGQLGFAKAETLDLSIDQRYKLSRGSVPVVMLGYGEGARSFIVGVRQSMLSRFDLVKRLSADVVWTSRKAFGEIIHDNWRHYFPCDDWLFDEEKAAVSYTHLTLPTTERV